MTRVVNPYLRAKNGVRLQRLSYAVINHWHLQTLVTGFNFSCEACKELQTINTQHKTSAAQHAIRMGSCASWNRIYSSNSIHTLYTEAFAPHKKYGGKGIHYVGGYTQAHLTLWRECYNSRSRYISCLFLIVIWQSLVSSLISIVRERERESQRDREVCHAVDY